MKACHKLVLKSKEKVSHTNVKWTRCKYKYNGKKIHWTYRFVMLLKLLLMSIWKKTLLPVPLVECMHGTVNVTCPVTHKVP